MVDGFVRHELADGHVLWEGKVPERLELSATNVEDLWAMHPDQYHEIKMHGRLVRTPRWQQAYGADYAYTGRVNKALPVPPFLEPYLTWVQKTVDSRLNGLLLNWYDAEFEHYIGKHKDSIQNMMEGAPIVTISLGAARIFRLRSWGRQDDGFIDFNAIHHRVFVMSYETNLAWTHEVPHRKVDKGRRISVTFRAFFTQSFDD